MDDQASLELPFRLVIISILVGLSLGMLISAHHQFGSQSCAQLVQAQISKLISSSELATQLGSQSSLQLQLPSCLDELVLGALPESQGFHRSLQTLSNYYYRIGSELVIAESKLGWGDPDCNPVRLGPGKHLLRISPGRCHGQPTAILSK